MQEPETELRFTRPGDEPLLEVDPRRPRQMERQRHHHTGSDREGTLHMTGRRVEGLHLPRSNNALLGETDRAYAHLSPSHLTAAVESVAAFGKGTRQATVSNGTVTQTGIQKVPEMEKTTEVT